MVFVQPLWGMHLLGNSLLDYLIALGVLVGLLLIFQWSQKLILRRLELLAERSETELDNALLTVVRTIKPPFYSYVSFYIALQYLNIRGLAEKAVTVILVVWLVYQAIVALQIFIDYYVKQRLRHTDDKSKKSVVQIIHTLSSIVLWTLGVLFVLSNVGVNVTSLIAGLGIGGIAVALAAQNILTDLFSSLAIYFDKPFVPGDMIVMGEHRGTVQHIGIRTTRIKSLTGEEIIVPNRELTGTLLRNIGRMKERRVQFTLGLVYETPTEKLRAIPDLVREVIEAQEKTRFDRATFKEFADSALLFEVVYYLETKQYDVYVNTHQAILFGIKEILDGAGIDMAYPTQTIYMHNSSYSQQRDSTFPGKS